MPIDTPTIEVAFATAAGGEEYIARVRATGSRQPMSTLNRPRMVVDKAVLHAAQPRLEVRLDGTVTAYLDSAGTGTLTSLALSELVAAAASTDALAGEDDPALVGHLEAELERTLEIVRRAHR